MVKMKEEITKILSDESLTTIEEKVDAIAKGLATLVIPKDKYNELSNKLKITETKYAELLDEYDAYKKSKMTEEEKAAKEKAAKAAAAKAALETLAADGIQENEKAEATELVAELADLGKVEEVVATDVEEVVTEEDTDGVAVKDIPMAPALDDVYVNSVYSVSQAVADVLNEGFWQQSSTKVAGRDIDVIATIKYWTHQGHTNRMIVVV